MFVCLCQQVKDTDIERTVAEGARDFADVQALTGAGTCCGQCSEFAKELSQSLINSKLFVSAA